MKVLFWVQHLLGVGHVARANVLAEAVRAEGVDVTMVLGGRPLPNGPRAERLPPVRATDQTFSQLVDSNAAPVTTATWNARRDALAAIHDRIEPDVVLIEAWPFGRRPFSHELVPLLERTRARVAVSVRDILHAGRKPGRAEETRDRVNALVDLVLVHADDELVRLRDTYPLADELTARVEHTGFVAAERAVTPRREADVVVSAGGGAFGAPLMRAATEAASRLPDLSFLVTTGRNLDAGTRSGIAAAAPANVRLVEHLDGLADVMAGARISVSQAGYNTVMDLFRAQPHGVRGLLVPSDVDGQNEQATRARLLGEAGRVQVLPESELTAEGLAQVIERILSSDPVLEPVDMNGARRSAELIAELA